MTYLLVLSTTLLCLALGYVMYHDTKLNLQMLADEPWYVRIFWAVLLSSPVFAIAYGIVSLVRLLQR